MEIVMIGNEKGGVGKTTLTRCLSEALTQFGYKTLMVDWDPSGNLTDCTLQVFPEYVLYDAFCGQCSVDQLICKTPIGDILPTVKELDFGEENTDDGFTIEQHDDKSLTRLANQLFGRAGGESKLRRFLWSPKNGFAERYDYVLIDTPPSDNILTTNAIVAANSVLMVCEPALSALSGVWKLRSLINTAKKCYVDVATVTDGVVISNYSESGQDSAMKKSIQTIQQDVPAENIYLYQTILRHSGNITSSMHECRPLMDYARTTGNGVQDMLNLGLEFLAARELAPRTEVPGVKKDEAGNWIYTNPNRNAANKADR